MFVVKYIHSVKKETFTARQGTAKVLSFQKNTDLKILSDTVRELTAKGLSVTAQKSVPEKLRYRQLLKLKESEVEILETHA